MTPSSIIIPAANNAIHFFRAVKAIVQTCNPSKELKAEVEKTYVFSAVKGYVGVFTLFSISGPLAGWELIKRIRRLISSLEWTFNTCIFLDVLKLPYDGLALAVILVRFSDGSDTTKLALRASSKIIRISVIFIPSHRLLLTLLEAAIKTTAFIYFTYGPNQKRT